MDFPRPRSGDPFTLTATCPLGQFAIGGGVIVDFIPPSVSDTVRIHLLDSGPVADSTAWRANAVAVSTTSQGSTMRYTVTALCVPTP